MYKIGDFVRTPAQKPAGADSSTVGWDFRMDALLGKVLQVQDLTSFSVRVGGWWWDPHWLTKVGERQAHRDSELSDWRQTEQRMRDRRDAHFRKIFGG